MIGNKAANLRKLKQFLGDTVPDFVVIEADWGMEELRRFDGVLTQDNAAEVSEKIRAHWEENYRDRALAAIRDVAIPWERCAVRSSSSLEDGEKASFAGQFATYLDVARKEVPERVWDCFLSAFCENILVFLVQKGIPLSSLSMSVIVQKMVHADCAGVYFGANPQGILNESVITVDAGLGENVVSGKTRPTSYYYNRTDCLYYYDGERDYLSREQIEELIRIADSAGERLSIEYPDMEFAVENGKIHVLQVRPITTCAHWASKSPLIFDNSNIVESYPGISLPLTCSFVNLIYAGVFRDVCRRVFKNDGILQKFSGVFRQMVGNANGRVYYKISNWYTILLALPFHKKIIPVWQEMMGVKNKKYDTNNVELRFWQRALTYIHVFTELFATPRNMDRLNAEFLQIQGVFRDTFRTGLSNAQLLDLFETLEERLFSCWGVTLLNDLYAFVFTGLLKKRLSAKYGFGADRVNRFIAGISNIESMKPIRALLDLCCAKESLDDSAFQKRFAQYIEDYGDRNVEELKLESRTFRSTPSLLERKIAEFTADPERLRDIRAKMLAQPLESQSFKGDFITRYLSAQCNRGIANREISRLNRSRIFGFVRSIVEEIGKNFARDGILDAYMDIHYLTLSEIYGILGRHRDGMEKSLDLERMEPKRIVAKRKAEYGMYALLPAYSRIVFADSEFNKSHTSVNSHRVYHDIGTLQGTPCSAGVVTAEALVVTDVTKIGNVAGKILVTKMTDPGWVFLLTHAAGVISEKGSLLSHTSIISRELKIPSIVGVQGLVDSVETGDILRMDGNTGTIEIIRKASHESSTV